MLDEKDLMNKLIKEFPEFYNSQDYVVDDLMPYSVFGDFAIYLQDGLEKNDVSQITLDKAKRFMNSMANSENVEINNLLVVGILEILTDKKISVDWVKSNLNEKACAYFERVMKGWV